MKFFLTKIYFIKVFLSNFFDQKNFQPKIIFPQKRIESKFIWQNYISTKKFYD